MRWIVGSSLFRVCGQAALTVVITTAVLYLLQNHLSTPIIALLYLLPVGISTTLWGLGAGITAAFGAFLAFNFFFIEPYHSLFVHQPQDLLALVIFFIVAGMISQLVARAQANLAHAQAREHEATHLYELSTALVGLREQTEIAQTVAQHIQQVFQAQAVQVTMQAGKQPVTVKIPPSLQPTNAKPSYKVPLLTARGLLGTVQLWQNGRSFTPNEERLLQTFVSQGALALEYALLADAETRAKVLEESDRLKSALLSSVSHELRTPLVTIKAAATSLLDGEGQWERAAREELLTAIASETDHLNRLVGNLLDMSRIEAGALNPQRQWDILADIVAEVNARIRRVIETHRLEIDVPEDLPLVHVDHVQMDQVFTNLLSNCQKYAPPQTTIRIKAWHIENAVQVCVSNEGPHVAQEHLERIFDKFNRITAVSGITSTGLGLSICKGIIEAHNGRIWAENLPNGFAFNFTIPLVWEGMTPPKLPTENLEVSFI